MRVTCLFSALLFGSALFAQITLDPLVTTTVCNGEAFEVTFQIAGTYDPGNVFNVELSDAAGSFASPTTIGMMNGTSAGSISCNPIGADGTGYRVRVVSTAPVDLSSASIEVLTLANPNAGMDASVTLCGAPSSIDIGSLLNGNPDPGGTWTIVAGTGILVGPDGPYVGLTYGSNILAYTVDVAGCTSTATLTIDCVEPPNAGVSGAIVLCSTDPPVNLFDHLGGTPYSGGAWTSPGGNSVSGTFGPSSDPPGIYSYIVAGAPPCANDAATVLITVTQAANAGSDASITICDSDAPLLLIDQLGGTPAPSGSWAFNSVAHAPVFVPGTDVAGCYVYTVPGSAPCLAEQSNVCITVNNCFQQPGSEFHPPYPDE
jgi:hypothetical protein